MNNFDREETLSGDAELQQKKHEFKQLQLTTLHLQFIIPTILHNLYTTKMSNTPIKYKYTINIEYVLL